MNIGFRLKTRDVRLSSFVIGRDHYLSRMAWATWGVMSSRLARVFVAIEICVMGMFSSGEWGGGPTGRPALRLLCSPLASNYTPLISGGQSRPSYPLAATHFCVGNDRSVGKYQRGNEFRF